MSSKVINALPELIENDVISKEVAHNIENYYSAAKEPNTNRLFTIFGVLGAILVGLGIILILAHNWDNFPRIVKTVLAFTPLAIGQAVLGYSIFKNKSTTWKEASSAFLFFAVGACIALISQIYNIPGDIEGYIFTWIVLCIPLLYLTKSYIALLLHLVFTTYYAFMANHGLQNAVSALWYTAFILVAIPRYVEITKESKRRHIANVWHWLFPLSIIISFPIYIYQNDGLGFVLYILLFGIFYNIGRLPYFANKELIQNGYRILGSLGTIIVLLFMSFKSTWEYSIRIADFASFEFLTAFVLGVICWILIYFSMKGKKINEWNLFQFAALLFFGIFLVGINNEILGTVLTNMLVLLLGIMAIRIGVQKMHFGILNYGMLIIAALIICRFFDTNMTFVFRGLLFVIVGAGFFTTNYLMLKKQQQKNTEL